MDIYQEVTNTVLEAMESAGPWAPLWDNQPSLPINRATGAPYQGINTVILWAAGLKNRFTSAAWLTYKQAAA